jgi:hypothetical protein
MPTIGPSGAGYEFSGEENKTFERLVLNLSRSGLVVIAASVVLLAYHFIDYFGLSFGKTASPVIVYVDYTVWSLISLLGVIIGVLLIRATVAFKALIRTEGDDLAHLMHGISRLANVLGLIFWAASGASALLTFSFILLLTYS